MFNPQGPSFFELVKQALSSTKEGYNLLAPKFDYTPYRTPDDLVSELAKHFPHDAESAIDICCGTGAGIKALVEQENLQRITGIDFSDAMLAEAKQKFGHDDRVECLEGDVLEMEFQEGFDLAICLGALGHFEERDYRRFVERVFAVLNSGGQYLFLAGPLPKPGSSLYWFCKAFNAALWIRNRILKPEFIMYYHKFMFVSDELIELMEDVGFSVDVVSINSSGMSDGLVQPGFKLVSGKKI